MNCDYCKEPITDACFLLNEKGERIHIRCLSQTQDAAGCSTRGIGLTLHQTQNENGYGHTKLHFTTSPFPCKGPTDEDRKRWEEERKREEDRLNSMSRFELMQEIQSMLEDRD